MRDLRPLRFACAVVAAPLLAGCGVSAYTPRPSPRLQMTTEGNGTVFVKNEHPYAFNMFGGNLEEAVAGNPEAEAEARAFKSKALAAFVLTTIGTVGTATGAGLLIGNQVQSTPSNAFEIGAISAIVGGAALSIVGGIVGSSAQPHLWNAINLYNDGLPAYPSWQPPAYPGYPGYPAASGYPAAPSYPAAPGYPGYPTTPGYPATPGHAPPGYAPQPGAPASPPLSPAPAPAPAPTPSVAPAPAPASQPH